MHWTKPHVLLQAGYLQVNLHVELDGYVKKNITWSWSLSFLSLPYFFPNINDVATNKYTRQMDASEEFPLEWRS